MLPVLCSALYWTAETSAVEEVDSALLTGIHLLLTLNARYHTTQIIQRGGGVGGDLAFYSVFIRPAVYVDS